MHGRMMPKRMHVMVAILVAGLFLETSILDMLLYLFDISVSDCLRNRTIV